MGRWLDDAIEIVYTDACVAGLHAKRKNDSDGFEKWYALANHIEDLYPEQIQALRDRMKPPQADAVGQYAGTCDKEG